MTPLPIRWTPRANVGAYLAQICATLKLHRLCRRRVCFQCEPGLLRAMCRDLGIEPRDL